MITDFTGEDYRPGAMVAGMTSDLEVATTAARAGAEVVAAGFGRTAQITLKGAVNPVTEVDHASEEAVRSVLADLRPGDGVLGEEGGGAGWDQGRVWIVDPLDGTINFVHGLPHVSTSVGLWEVGRPLVGVVIDVTRGETFTAAAGQGAFLDGAPISVSDQTEFRRGLIVTGFPYDRNERAAVYAAVMARVLAEAQGIRRTGSAALDLCWVAAGRFEGYWESGLAPWDAAAGSLIVSEAGGRVTGFGGVGFRLDSTGLVATNGRLHDRLVGLVGDGS